MIASNIDEQTLRDAASEIGVAIEMSAQSGSGRRFRVKLYPIVPADAWQVARNRQRICPVCGERVRIKSDDGNGRLIGSCGDAAPAWRWANGRRWPDERGDAKYQRTSAAVMFREGRRVHAVCWHGFRDFFRACFRREPDAKFYTALDKWLGSEDFERRFAESGHRNIGAPIAPVCAAGACRCGEEGYAG